MTDQELKDYYANLLILQYKGPLVHALDDKSKAQATVEANVEPVIMNQLPVTVQDAFAIGSAIGVQLDVIGKYAGVTRSGNTSHGFVILNDADFTILIQIAIIQNNNGSSLATIQNLLNTYFPGQIFVFDYANMHMSYLIDSSIGSQDLVELFVSKGLLPKPMGVQLTTTTIGPVIDAFFGFRTYLTAPHNISPFNTYTTYHMDYPWLSYADGI